MSEQDDLDQDPEFQVLVQAFLARLPQMVEEINAALTSKNWQAFESVSHKLKGMGGGFGFPELTVVGQKLNTMVREKSYDYLAREVEQLNSMYTAIMQKHKKSA